MGRVTSHQANYFRSVEILQANAALKPMAQRVAAYQIGMSDASGLLLDGEQVGLIGFYPLGDGVEECFFACLPIERLGGAFLPLQRRGRLIIQRRLHYAGVRKIVALVACRNDRGQRLARLAGFSLPPDAEPTAGFDRWELTAWEPSSKA